MAADNSSNPTTLFGPSGPDPAKVYLVPIAFIGLPDLRVTSTFTPEQTQELEDSLRTEGQKDPVKLVYHGGQLVLADGLNRILALQRIGVPQVKALIQTGTVRDIQIANIITARHRGRENPAQTADVISDLLSNEHMDPTEIKKRLGLGDTVFRRLVAISALPSEVKDHVKYARLGVGAAYHLSQLHDAMKIVTIANQAVLWQYTEEQVKAAVMAELDPDKAKETQTYVFTAEGRPMPVYPKCALCGQELQAYAEYVYLCPADKETFEQFRQAYTQQAEQQ